ncbi:2-oxoacid:acceptor oxidoreductase subunit alpha [Aeromicrobium ponti]|uniref:2-oxoglutarate ferredoxin oxidoreductase subunit alpha n=1 Tax=Cytobacillus oceanisediminis TaxID=665099 RepID=A0A562JRS5_9BACI|nr:2-oxoacid:acceptor oxidoreductase subunit alpha [Cytobacillus oceanisediminis]TWH85869.1 2-oxoglutarate ferredoxin oxidoreductase subunit alpha [Cytobacillus oceanisediminis]
MEELTIVIGGEQGEGIESVGEILTKVLSQMGFSLYGFRNFSSRIKGGHSDFNLRISSGKEIYVNAEKVNILVAFDRASIDLYINQMDKNSIILYDSKSVKSDNLPIAPKGVIMIEAPFQELASELGSPIMKNMVALGMICALNNHSASSFHKVIQEQFLKKGMKISQLNVEAFEKGYAFIKEKNLFSIPLVPAINSNKMFLSGNEAMVIGALASGCRFMAGYPITPASEILENMINMMPEFGGVVVQAEDELSSVAMSIGASFAGTRSMTATSGPGISLMQEAIGLSGAIEIPLVIIDTQRGGPSSGLATKMEQSDLTAMLGGTHGEIPRIIISPSTVQEAIYDMNTAFNLAEKYQCPVFIAADLVLSTSKQSAEILDPLRIEMERGKRVSDEELAEQGKALYDRFAFTDDHISPRTIPGQKFGTHHATGIEHGQTGHPTEDYENRKKMMIKRMKKIETVTLGEDIKAEGEGEDLLLIGFGSTYGAIREACEAFNKDGIKAGLAHIRLLHPFPADQLEGMINKARQVIVIENNYTGQLADVIKQHIPDHSKIQKLSKFDGRPFAPSDIRKFCKELV